ncbi:MAG: GDSL-type esterase/lipase family protein [Bacillota bacterium]
MAFFGLIKRKQNREVRIIARRNLYAKQVANTPKGGVVFFGDSITEMYDLDTFYPNKGYINRGISGNVSSELLGRVFNSVVALQPKQVILLIGVNDLANEIHKPYAFQNIRVLIDVLLAEISNLNLVVQAVYPINNFMKKPNWKTLQQDIVDLNASVSDYCNQKNVTFVSAREVLQDKNGALNLQFSADGLHLNKLGYNAVTEVLSPYLI